jgi:hypothetical protein
MQEIELPNVEFAVADGIFIKQMHMDRAGTYVPQHSHKYDHTSMLATGSIRVWQNDICIGDFKAPIPIEIKAGVKHTFVSLEPNTTVWCIHRIDRTGDVEVDEYHERVSTNILGGESCRSV